MTHTIPEGATHRWIPGGNTLVTPYGSLHRLSYYKFEGGSWYVFSERTGWRPSSNPDEWFTGEIIEGFFKEI